MTLHEIKHANAAAGFHFFSPDTMRCFSSRALSETFESRDGSHVYIVTSEKFRGFRAPDGDRLYTVRMFCKATGGVDTIGKFQQFRSRTGALSAAKRMAESNRQPINPSPTGGTGPKCSSLHPAGEPCRRYATHDNAEGEPNPLCCEHVL